MNNKNDRWKGAKGNILAKLLNSPLRKFEILILGDYKDAFFKELKKYIITGNETIIDLGAGSGYFSLLVANELKKGKVISVDNSDKMLKTLKRKVDRFGFQQKIEVHNADILSTGLADNSADIIITNFVLHELSDLNKAVSEMKRIVKPKGKIIFIDFNADVSFGKMIKLLNRNKDHGPLNLHEFRNLFNNFSFNNVKIEAIRNFIFGVVSNK